MFGWLKKLRKEDDLDDIKSSVLGDFGEPEPDFSRREPDFPRRESGRNDLDPLSEPPGRGFGDRRGPEERRDFERFDEPPGFNTIDTRVDKKSDNYDIVDRLNLIESQLSAIRSQTETINERLKNIERSLPRRY